ncbi:MAG: PotD/PotF family extracellular solute-binding protein, partial [Acetanaerobacterium sp.]
MKRLLSAIAVLGMALVCAVPVMGNDTIGEGELYDRFQGQGMTLNVFNWGEYISDGSDDSLNINAEFEARTGIKVQYSTFASNEELYAKLKSGGSQYDVIIPSDYMISRMIKEDMLEELDYSLIPNFSMIMDEFKDPNYDPGNRFSVPYMWGTVGIIYNTAMVDKPVTSWDILWDEDYSGKILMFSNSRDAFGVSLSRLGYSQNTENEDELRAASDELKKQKPLVQMYVMDEIFDKMQGEEAALAPYYAGDAITMIDTNPNLAWAVPEEGTNRFVDAMCIPKDAANKQAAELYINFMTETDIAVANCKYAGYSTPHSDAFDALDKEITGNP